jgi:HSP20 family molecular chaperone IbpA
MASEITVQKTLPAQAAGGTSRGRRFAGLRRPGVDIFETADELMLVADLPGAEPGSIDVSLERGILTIEAGIRTREPARGRSLVQEFGAAGFQRRFEIDDTIDPEAVSADYRDGSLTVHLPKARQARRRQIPVTA